MKRTVLCVCMSLLLILALSSTAFAAEGTNQQNASFEFDLDNENQITRIYNENGLAVGQAITKMGKDGVFTSELEMMCDDCMAGYRAVARYEIYGNMTKINFLPGSSIDNTMVPPFCKRTYSGNLSFPSTGNTAKMERMFGFLHVSGDPLESHSVEIVTVTGIINSSGSGKITMSIVGS